MSTMTIDRRFLPVIPDHAGEDTPGVPDEFGAPLDIQVDEAQTAEIRPKVVDALKKVFDPEIPVNIYELGLIYDCRVDPPAENGRHPVAIKMTLTAPGCGMGDVLAQDVRTKLERMEDVGSAEVEIVFDPPWNPSMMSEAARLQLGFF